MKTFYISCLFLCALVSFVYSLECYRCKDCIPGAISFLNDVDKCSDKFFGADKAKCYKSVQENGNVNRGCTTSSNCLIQEIDKCSNPEETGCYICCGKDKCNSGSAVTSGIAICIASLFFFLVLM
ncbi:uncharacterized protein [Amphiura filiformis]|uniref:uncharacterized protein n=1 Tax=Amphiura filiformis TaxID=82378 RepID=UPI003B219D60